MINSIVETNTRRIQPIRNIDWERLQDRCIVFRDFMRGVDVHHDVTWFIAANLIHLDGGEGKFFDGLVRRPEYNTEKWLAHIAYMRQKRYKAPGYHIIEDYYPDAADQATARTLVEAASLPRGTVHVYDPPTFEPLSIVEERMQQAFHHALEQTENCVIVIRADTGIGKTEMVLQAIGKRNAFLLVVPTHKLKDEIQARAEAYGKTVLVSPALPQDMRSCERDLIDQCYRTGAAPLANVKLRELAETNSAVAEYVAANDALAEVGDVTVITTHARLPFLDTQHDTIIIDEDIVPTLFPHGETTIKDIEQLYEIAISGGFGHKSNLCVDDRQTIARIVESVRAAPQHRVQEMPACPLENERGVEQVVVDTRLQSNVLGFLSATHFIKEGDKICFVCRRQLSPNKKIIILSATANKIIYELICGNVTFVETGHAQRRGSIRQYHDHSFSRQSLDKNNEFVQRAAKLANGQPVITYKQFADIFDDVVTTFGALAGIDSLGGQDIAIIGTPNLHPNVYLLFGSALGIPIQEQDYEPFQYRPVRRNGYEFRFNTFAYNPLLQELQLHLVESELLQAVGRARVLRNDCCVTVLSNFPVLGATSVVSKADCEEQRQTGYLPPVDVEAGYATR